MKHSTSSPPDSKPDVPAVPFREALKVWLKVALLSFGGPAGQISVMHKFLVEQKQWISETRFLHALNYCMLLPGPEAQQLATYIGWVLHKVKGGIIAGGLFVLPGFISILVLSILYAVFAEADLVQALFFGIKPAVLAIVLGAVYKIGQKALKNGVMVSIALLAFVGIFFLNVPFPLIIIGAGIIGFLGGRFLEDKFQVVKGKEVENSSSEIEDQDTTRPPFKNLFKTLGIWLTLWFVPVIALVLLFEPGHIFVQQSIFFSQVAVVTFGGAYAVLAYVAQQAVETHGWLLPGEMLDGLGMAETTPGPLIQVVQFVAFMGAFRNPGAFDPVVAGIIASFLVTWVIFIPCFLFIFSGAPYIEYLRGNKSLTAALSGITAAVVGVILNLGIWFSMNTLFTEVVEKYHFGIRILTPVVETLEPGALLITVIALTVHFVFRWGMMKTLLSCVTAGMIYYFIFM